MKKIALLFVMFALISCGGGGGGSSSGNSTDINQAGYDLWEYMVSDTSITKYFDWYETDENFVPTGESEMNAGQVRETYLSETTVLYEEITDGTVDTTETLILSGDSIQVVGGNTIPRYRNIGNAVGGECHLKQHYDTYNPLPGYTFYDVIEVDCGDWSEFYAKGLGLIMGQNISTWLDDDDNPIAIDYSIAIANL